MSQDKLLRVNVAAKRLGCTEQHVRRLVRQGKIDYFRESSRKTYIPESAVEAFREEHSENS
jgi:excisionase family DNA binding protein